MLNLKQFEFLDSKNRRTLSLHVLENLASQAKLKIRSKDKKDILKRLVEYVQKNEIQEEPGTVTGHYAGRNTRCKFCFFPIIVNGTQKTKLQEEGKVLITRFIKCIGPGNHKYPLKEILTAKALNQKQNR